MSPRSLKDIYAVAATIRNFAYFKEENYEQWRTLLNVIFPSNYRVPKNDIAVLFVVEPFEFNDLVKPIRMADRYIDYEGIAMASGYGEISQSSNRCRDLRNLPENVTMRVHGGKPVALGEIPYQVGFKTRITKDPKRFYTFCGGAIIGESKILSAAHCFVDESPNSICPGSNTSPRNLNDLYAVAATIRNFGYFEGENYEQWRTLRNLTYPHDYRFPTNDIAVLFVMKPFEFNDLVKPIRMADRYIDYGGICLVSGYGAISHSVLSDTLLQADLLLFPYWYCAKLHPSVDMSHSICTSLVRTDIGKGDSGGPLVYTHGVDLEGKHDRTLIGIASGTYEGLNSIFVRVSSYRAFIANNRCEENTYSICYFVVNTLIILQNYIDMQF